MDSQESEHVTASVVRFADSSPGGSRQQQQQQRVLGGDPLKKLVQLERHGSQDEVAAGHGIQASVDLPAGKMLMLAGVKVSESAARLQAVQKVSRKFYWFKRLSDATVEQRWFALVGVSLVLIDLITTLLEVNHYEELRKLFDGLALALALCFTVEFAFRLASILGGTFDRLLFFEAVLVAVAWVDVFMRYSSPNSPPHVAALASTLRIARLVRIIRLSTISLDLLPVASLLASACHTSLAPMLTIFVVLALIIFTFALATTLLVPMAATGDEVVDMALERFGSVARSAYSLTLMMTGGFEWGTVVAFKLYEGSAGSVVMVFILVLASFVLVLAIGGVITGTFLDQFHLAAEKQNEFMNTKRLNEASALLVNLSNCFAEEGFLASEQVSWPEVHRISTANPVLWESVGVSIKDAKKLFRSLDETCHGHVGTQEFIFGIFKVRSLSRSIDMMSVDYQQEKALQQLSDLRTNLRLSVACVQSKLFNTISMLQALERELVAVEADIVRVQGLQKVLLERRKDRAGLESLSTSALPCSPPTADEIRENLKLSDALVGVEAALQSLGGDGQAHGGFSEGTDRVVAVAVADSMVKSIRSTLHDELSMVLART